MDRIKLKQEAYNIYGKKKLYQPIEHPDFAGWRTAHKCTDRLRSIVDFIGDVKGKRVLDIGCCTGWFSHKLARMGAKVVGLDLHKTRISIARMLNEYYGLSPKNPVFHIMGFENYLKPERTFDFILFLSLLHHFLRKNLQLAWNKVNLISKHTNTMFMDLSYAPKYCRRIKGNAKLAVPKLVLKHSKFRSFKRLPAEGRRLYAFT